MKFNLILEDVRETDIWPVLQLTIFTVLESKDPYIEVAKAGNEGQKKIGNLLTFVKVSAVVTLCLCSKFFPTVAFNTDEFLETMHDNNELTRQIVLAVAKNPKATVADVTDIVEEKLKEELREEGLDVETVDSLLKDMDKLKKVVTDEGDK